jgi:hypothetical protein
MPMGNSLIGMMNLNEKGVSPFTGCCRKPFCFTVMVPFLECWREAMSPGVKEKASSLVNGHSLATAWLRFDPLILPACSLRHRCESGGYAVFFGRENESFQVARPSKYLHPTMANVFRIQRDSSFSAMNEKYRANCAPHPPASGPGPSSGRCCLNLCRAFIVFYEPPSGSP